MVFITGDTHIPVDIHKLSVAAWPEQKNMTKDDYLIVCGDFGLIFNYKETGQSVPACPEDTGWTKEELFWYKWLNEKSFTTLWIDGNHENFERLKKYPITEWHGGNVQKISDSIIHLMRGQIYEMDGYSIFTLGGAQSHDRGTVTGTEKRDIHKWWWREELPSENEYEKAFRNLEAHGNEVDVILTHEAPGNILLRMGCSQNDLSNNLWKIYDTIKFKQWYCGHHHVDEQFGRVVLLYDSIVNINKEYTYTLESNNDKISIGEHYEYHDDDGQSGSHDIEYTTARDILNLLDKVVSKK